eukprot:6491363-Amphidinium_carterae.3
MPLGTMLEAWICVTSFSFCLILSARGACAYVPGMPRSRKTLGVHARYLHCAQLSTCTKGVANVLGVGRFSEAAWVDRPSSHTVPHGRALQRLHPHPHL